MGCNFGLIIEKNRLCTISSVNSELFVQISLNFAEAVLILLAALAHHAQKFSTQKFKENLGNVQVLYTGSFYRKLFLCHTNLN
jgi:hypothetical protein